MNDRCYLFFVFHGSTIFSTFLGGQFAIKYNYILYPRGSPVLTKMHQINLIIRLISGKS